MTKSRWIALLLGVVVCLSASAQTELKKVAPKRAALKELQLDTTKRLNREELPQQPVMLKEAPQQMQLTPVSDKVPTEIVAPAPAPTRKKKQETEQDSVAKRVRSRREVEPQPTTLPDTLAKTCEEMKPLASPIMVPTLTRSPTLTVDTAGLPMCIDIGMDTVLGTGMRTVGFFTVFLR